MTDLIVVPQAAHWQRLKRLVLDSVSSPITRRVYNLGLDEFFEWYERGTPARIHKGYGERLEGCVGGSGSWAPFRSTCASPQYGNWRSRPRITGCWRPSWPTGSRRVKGVASKGVRLGSALILC